MTMTLSVTDVATDGEHIELDALEFGWTLAGRARAEGLLTTRVPF